jgi:hypothetical protein
VIAHEYPGPLTEILAYGLAGGVSAARVVGHQHFVSDVILGSALGWYLGRQVFRSHSQYSDAEIARWGTFSKGDTDTSREARNMGSPYVPLDSWIYPAMDRLTALGYVHTGFADMRPWTRMECARQIKEASDRIAEDESQSGEAARLNQALQKEFAREVTLLGGGENAEFRVESAYTRSTEIVGKPLTDGDHFGQTIVNDFGRPEEQGFNDVSGLSGWSLSSLCPRGIAAFALRPHFALDGSRRHIPGGFQPQRRFHAVPCTARLANLRFQPRPVSGYLRGLESLRLAILLRESEPLVGTLPGRPHDVQRQRSANPNVSRKPGHTLYASQYFRRTRRHAPGGLHRAILRV